MNVIKIPKDHKIKNIMPEFISTTISIPKQKTKIEKEKKGKSIINEKIFPKTTEKSKLELKNGYKPESKLKYPPIFPDAYKSLLKAAPKDAPKTKITTSLFTSTTPINRVKIKLLKNLIKTFKETKEKNNKAKKEEIGKVISVKDGVAFITGLENVAVGEMISFVRTKITGLVLNLQKDKVGCIIFAEDYKIKQGDIASRENKLLDIKVSDALIGRVIDAIGNPIDGNGVIAHPKDAQTMRVERKAPGVITRYSVKEPLLTGYKIIDALVPIGRGQRELIIGDRQTGKTTLAIDTIINQRNSNILNKVFCIYVGIGQKRSSILHIHNILIENNAMDFSTIVTATASESAALQYIAPYTGCAIGEYFRDSGRHALIVYDDLTKHAVAYRQLSLLLRRPPGREAYPGDVFYLHSRLLERAAKLNEDHGFGSLTALPIIETQAGDLAGYIPTNVISITDGQIFLDKKLFFKGIRPAVNVGNSVSRVGASAQPFVLKEVSKTLKLDLAQYREYSIFSQFDSDIDETTKNILFRGGLLTEVLKQGPHQPLPLFFEILMVYSAVFNFIDDIPLKDIEKYESSFQSFIKEHKKIRFFPYYFRSLNDNREFDAYENPLILLIRTFYYRYYVKHYLS